MLVFKILMLATAACWAIAAGWSLFETGWHLVKRRRGWGAWAASSAFTLAAMTAILLFTGLAVQADPAMTLAGR